MSHFVTSLILMAAAAAASPASSKTYRGKFLSCYDGDTCTFDLELSDKTLDLGAGITERVIITKRAMKVRLCGIDAPEMSPGPNPAAIKARDDLNGWITSAKDVSIEVPQRRSCALDSGGCDKTDKYGRLLGSVVADGVNLNQRQLTTGNAVPFMGC